MKPIRIILVEDHNLVRQGLHSILDLDPCFDLMDEAASGADGLRLVTEKRPDVVLLDLQLPDMSGVELCQRILQASPGTAVLVLTAFFSRDLVHACLQAGARGYLLKDAEHLHLKEQIRTVAEGHVALDPRAASVLVNHIHRRGPAPEALTLRELKVLRLIAQGQTNKEIGVQLHLSEHTIKGHVRGILSKLDVHSRVEAVLRARECSLI